MTTRKHPSAGFWITVALVAAQVGYPLSLGPACWWLSKSALDDIFPRAPRIYWPLGWLALNGPEPVRQSLCWYANARKKGIMLPTDPGGSRWYRP
jgi:hypothetical protein